MDLRQQCGGSSAVACHSLPVLAASFVLHSNPLTTTAYARRDCVLQPACVGTGGRLEGVKLSLYPLLRDQNESGVIASPAAVSCHGDQPG